MATKIKCSNCGNEVEITEAIKKELEESVVKELNLKHQNEIRNIKEKSEKEIEERTEKIENEAKRKAIEKVRREYDSKIEETKEESKEAMRQNKELQSQIKEIMQQLREQKNINSSLELDYQKKLMEDEEKIKNDVKKEADEEYSLKMLEQDKQIKDAHKHIKDLERKLQQHSQQTQGEILELKVEDLLRNEFPVDEIREVSKGIRGADVVQIVKNNADAVCGTIIWELKNQKKWSPSWIQKLKDDQRAQKADIPVLISVVLPNEIKCFGICEGIWVSDLKSFIGLAHSLRSQLQQVYLIKQANKGKEGKAEVVYNYLISNAFKQRIEVFIEYFNNRREEIEKERRMFTSKWQKEEQSVRKVIDNTAGIYGDLQGLTGSALPKIQTLELPTGEDD